MNEHVIRLQRKIDQAVAEIDALNQEEGHLREQIAECRWPWRRRHIGYRLQEIRHRRGDVRLAILGWRFALLLHEERRVGT